ncbi:MAG: M23 family metallopeptidase [Ruaniaceae bacterium]|nr:M23 family metallopeptidase [Ruaniaceae bacterium]
MTRWFLPVYRYRGMVYIAAVLLLLLVALTTGRELGEIGNALRPIVALIGLCALAVSLMLITFGPRSLPERDAVIVAASVRGRWVGMNSPADKVPSHGIRMYGQAYAIDLVHEPVDAVRELGGPGFILGNHVTIRNEDGAYALAAHLQQNSVAVRVGETVRAGEQIGRCGNSGNSSEPHVHAQLMDRLSPLTAQGIPFVFAGITFDDDARLDALPKNGQHMRV